MSDLHEKPKFQFLPEKYHLCPNKFDDLKVLLIRMLTHYSPVLLLYNPENIRKPLGLLQHPKWSSL